MDLTRSEREHRSWPLYGEYVVIAVVAVFMVAALGYGLLIVTRIANTHEPQAESAQSFRFELTASHLWLDEALNTDDSGSQAAVLAFHHLERAEAYLHAMGHNGTTPAGEHIVPSNDPATQRLLERMERLMVLFRGLADRHFPVAGSPPPPASLAAETDHIYGGLLRIAEAMYARAQGAMNDALTTFRRDLSLLIVASFLMGLGAMFYVRGFERRKAIYRATLEQEIHERKQVQEGLGRAQAIAHLGHWEWQVGSGGFSCSDETRRILGIDDATPMNGFATLLAMVHPDDRERLEDHLNQVREGAQDEPFDHRVVRPDGSERQVRAQLALAVPSVGDERVVGTLRDVTHARRAEAAAAASEARYQHLFQTISQGMVLHGEGGEVISANPAAEAMLGLTVAEMTSDEAKLPLIGAVFEDGARVTVENSPAAVAQASGCPIIGQVVAVTPPEGGPPRWLLVSATPQFESGDASPSHVHVGYTDITEQRQMEEEYRQARRMEALGTLVGGIAHDFNNILTSLQGTLHLAQRRLGNDDAVREKLVTAEQLGHRAADMVNQLLAFSRQRKVALAICNLTKVVQDGVRAARVGVPEAIALQGGVPEAVLNVHGNANMLQQVLVNLIFNARDALEGRALPVIGISLGAMVTDEALRRRHPDLPVGQCAVLSVTDNGCGIPPDHIEKLFEPFFTTKEVGRGTGLGLAMCYGTVRAHGGAMEVKSEEGKGTTFRIYLPLSGVAPATHPTVRPFDSPRARAGETILLADDEELVRLTAHDLLEDLGYKVLAAKDGAEACDIFDKHPKEISLALMDVVMPKMGGVESVRHMRKTRPDLPVIFATGYDRDSVLPETDQWEPVVVLSKPYPMARIGWQVRELIDGRRYPGGSNQVASKP